MKAAAIRHTTCEKEFVLKSIKSGIRLDGRQSYDYRNIDIKFGVDYGCCEVQLGDTRVLAQTSAELIKPVDTRPTEGQLFLNVELSPMASPAFENGRQTDNGVEINRLVERCLKESRPIDVESLCLVAGEKVWAVRVDILVLNDAGNILDCSCIAAICALAHFRRPDVTITGNDVVIHSLDEKEAVLLNIHHMPICSTFGFIGEGEQIIIDPEEKEESIMSGKMTLAFNIHGELCCSQMSGGVALDYEQIMQCSKIASVKAIEITQLIKEQLEEDRVKRAPAKVVRREGLKDPVTRPTITKTVAEATEIDMETVSKEIRDVETICADKTIVHTAERLGHGTAGIGTGGNSKWVISDHSDEEMDYCDQSKPSNKNNDEQKPPPDIDLEDSEEEDLLTLKSSELEENISSKTIKNVNDKDNDENDDPKYPQTNTNSGKVKKKKKKKKKSGVTS